jgi:hypothetical protein
MQQSNRKNLKVYSYISVRFFASLGMTGILLLSNCRSSYAQHTSHEIGVSFAYGGQVPFITSGNDPTGFFRKPIIFNVRYQVATNYLQSLAIVLENIGEERNRTGLWSDIPNSASGGYNANISERLTMTTLGLEGIRTLLRTDEFRLGIGISLGYGFGGATALVRKIADGSEQTFESCDSWNGLLVSIFTRGRYTVFMNSSMDIGVTGSVRIWGFPSISPLSDCQSSYNGPQLRSVFEAGYLAGISVGFK